MSPTVGVIGGGQLARMMIPPALALGIDIRVLAESAGESANMAVTSLGDYRDVDDVLRFADGVDVITFDHEHVPDSVLRALLAAGVSVQPSPDALLLAQDKIVMRSRLSDLGIPVPDWAEVRTSEGLAVFLADHGGRAVVKTPRGGYDGKGVRLVERADQVDDWFEAPGGPLLVEELVEFRRELAQLVARRPSGEMAVWPVVESVQRDGVCAEVIAPAPDSTGTVETVASAIARTIAEELGVTGVLAVELFETTDERLLVNELAMRPHNTGHWTIDGSLTSQFEQHLRAVLDLPLGATDSLAEWSVMINVLGGPGLNQLDQRDTHDRRTAMSDRYAAALADQPAVKFHAYGKESRLGRKVGHVTAVGADLDDTVFRARAAAGFFED
jgi:5-(carboxyamino)imidazole ribonucleotide synthase